MWKVFWAEISDFPTLTSSYIFHPNFYLFKKIILPFGILQTKKRTFAKTVAQAKKMVNNFMNTLLNIIKFLPNDLAIVNSIIPIPYHRHLWNYKILHKKLFVNIFINSVFLPLLYPQLFFCKKKSKGISLVSEVFVAFKKFYLLI